MNILTRCLSKISAKSANYIGCFESNHTLNIVLQENVTSYYACMMKCRALQTRLVAVSSKSCACANDDFNSSLEIDNERCNYSCPIQVANTLFYCGGINGEVALSVTIGKIFDWN